MRLVVQIPCFNEEETLPSVLEDIPHEVEGFDEVLILVIDDGSTDRTVAAAKANGADRVLRLRKNRGLARAFGKGIEAALEMGADVIVNTDGDHQYQGKYIPHLIAPIIGGQADMVVGDRDVSSVVHFSKPKIWLQKIGSAVVRRASGTNIRDATSGFRALSREAALRLVIYSDYTYTVETIIQAGKKSLIVTSVPVKTNEKLRESRLIRGNTSYVQKSATTILRFFLMYEPLRAFSFISLAPFIASVVLFVRYGVFYFSGEGAGHVQSVVVASVLLLLAFQVFLLGLLADLIGRIRAIGEENSYQLRKQALARDHIPPTPDSDHHSDEASLAQQGASGRSAEKSEISR
jgi:glycosyltransferase involved in cell wall biosynthesis